MANRRVILLRSNPVAPDPPVEKAADALLSFGYEVTVVGWNRDEEFTEQTDVLNLERGVAKVVRFGIPAVFGGGMKNFVGLYKFQKKLKGWLKNHRNEFDVIHAFDFDTGYVARKIAKKYGKRLVYHILDFYVESHHLPTKFLNKFVKRAEFKIINGADHSVICTEKRREQIAGSNPKKLSVIHNTPKQPSEELGFMLDKNTDGRARIVYVGILAGGRFIREVVNFVKSDERFELHIGGFGNMEKEIAKAAEECDRIFFYGKLPYAKTLALENSCDIMTAIYNPAVPNHRYAAPNKFYESLMLGKPVVMAKNTGFDEIIEENNVGCLIEYSEEGLAFGFNNLYEQKDNWENISSRMKELYKNSFSWAEMERRLGEIYSEFENE